MLVRVLLSLCLLFSVSSTLTAAENKKVEDIEIINTVTTDFTNPTPARWVWCGNSRMPVLIRWLSWLPFPVIVGKYNQSMQEIDLEYLSDVHELLLAVREAKSGVVEAVKIEYIDDQELAYNQTFELKPTFYFEKETIKKVSSNNSDGYGAAIKLPLKELEGKTIKNIYIYGKTIGWDATRVRVDFFVPSRKQSSLVSPQ